MKIYGSIGVVGMLVFVSSAVPVAAHAAEITLAPASITSYLEDGEGKGRVKVTTSISNDAAGCDGG